MSKRLENITQQRLDKLKKLREQGIEPYPAGFQRSHTTREARALIGEESQADGVTVSIAGRIRAQRGMGKATFVDLQDGSGRIQAYFRRDQLGDERYALIQELDIGDFVGVTGGLFKTRSGETTVNVSDFSLLAKSLQPLPEKWHGLVDVEKRYRQRYLDLISNDETKDLFLTRSRIIAAMRRFLDNRGFIEMETPILQPIAGGARARPFITHHHALDRDFYLRIATELHLKRLIVGGFDKVYEIGRIFRNEGISTKHNPEFTTLESYEAYADYADVMNMLEAMVYSVTEEAIGTAKVAYGDTILDFTPPWKRISLEDALRQTCGIELRESLSAGPEALRNALQQKGMELDETMSPAYLVDKLVSTYVEPTLVQPTFLIDYPVETTPLAKTKKDNPAIVERFEAFAAGMEFANAFSELNDPIEQSARFEIQEEWRLQFGDEEAEQYQEDFIAAMEYGMPPTGGLGVGIDRLVMLLCNQQSIREVILFPQLKTR